MSTRKKLPLTNAQAIFVLKGQLSTIARIRKECKLHNSNLAITKAKAGLMGLILALSPKEEPHG